MFNTSLIIKIVAVVAVVTLIILGFRYVTGLRADLAVSEMNNQTLREGIKDQQALIEKMQIDVKAMQEINEYLRKEADRQREEVRNLIERFNTNAQGNSRDLGSLAVKRPSSIERVINQGSKNAMRCLEIASGAPLTEQELNAKTLGEINRECPSLANPNYIPGSR